MLVVGEFLLLFVLHLSNLFKAAATSVRLENKAISPGIEANIRAKRKVKPVCMRVRVYK